jgi:chromosome segregation ATPase
MLTPVPRCSLPLPAAPKRRAPQQLAAAQAEAAAVKADAAAAEARVRQHVGQMVKALQRQAALQQHCSQLAAQADAFREQLQAAHAEAAAHQQHIKVRFVKLCCWPLCCMKWC